MLCLGIIYKKDIFGNYKAISHRSLVKILINPILSIFGYVLESQYCPRKDAITGIRVCKVRYKKPNLIHNYQNIISYDFDNSTMKIRKIRIIL